MAVRGLRWLAAAALLGATLGSGGGGALASTTPVDQTGVINGAAYRIEIPKDWNGTLLLYSHGYVVPGSNNPPTDVGDPVTHDYLLDTHYGLAGSAYRTTGWAVHEALEDQIALLNFFDHTFGKPKRTIAWGHSLGGMITAGLVQQHPNRFDGALPMCGVLAGGVGVWNVALDAEFVFKTLLAAPDSKLQLVNIADPSANLTLAETILAQAQATPQGRARIALAAAVGDLPGWFNSALPEPAANDFTTREANQYLWDSQVDFPFAFDFRAELEGRAGGNPSWNTDVNYRHQLAISIDRDEVEALYAAAGLSLDHDLDVLAHTPRIDASQPAMRYLTHNIVFDGDVGDTPVLTIHTIGDGLVLNQDEQAYASIVNDRHQLLRQAFVDRAGHCTFTPAETIAALNALVQRVKTGRWSGVDPADLNAGAARLDPTLNLVPAAYQSFKPTKFPRPFSIADDRR
jgi:pimeloyl-ACP methyl ester carboxylesterase